MFEKIFAESINWEYFVPNTEDFDFLDKYQDRINWNLLLSVKRNLINLENFLHFKNNFDKEAISCISRNIPLSNEVLDNQHLLNIQNLYRREDFFFEGIDVEKVDWELLSLHTRCPEEKILEYIDYFNLETLGKRCLIPKSIFWNDFKSYLNKEGKIPKKYICEQEINQDFVSNNLKYFDLESLLYNLPLEEEFIEKLLVEHKQDLCHLNLPRIKTQLSATFIRKHYLEANAFDWTRYQCELEKTGKELFDLLHIESLYIFKDYSEDFYVSHKKDVDLYQVFPYVFELRNEEKLSSFRKLFPEELKNYEQSLKNNRDSYYYEIW